MSFLGGALAGSIGGGLAVTVLAPLTAANNFLGSYFFGSGMILGERQMYQDDWIKIKQRLDAGESFLVILEEVMKPNTQAVMQMARETVIAVSAEWNKIVLDYMLSLPKWILEVFNIDTRSLTADNLLGDTGDTTTPPVDISPETEPYIIQKYLYEKLIKLSQSEFASLWNFTQQGRSAILNSKDKADIKRANNDKFKIGLTPTKTPEDAIAATNPADDVKWIALQYAKINNILRNPALQITQRKIVALNEIKKFNQYVTSHRKANGQTYANLQIDSAKTLAAMTIIPKT